MTRTAFICVAALIVSAGSASAQGKAPKPIVISQTVLKSMTANKSRSKKPLGAKAGLVRKANVAASQPTQAAPTSVREIGPIAKKN